ncbi:MAG TPA: tRNA (guanosine(37)-N1)-methyltransferase TrmD [Xanthomonadaceae bacterium]|jgi:tRNA (guanine37-N1)-methyltransferase|nr:tRNA (guanosine(37)-N1)-methyltransferase TrmD [Xanthomonadaceae bacterium]
MRLDVITLFPDFMRQCADVGVVGRARERGLLQLETWNPRDYATGNYRRVDERPFGGGPGMLMLIEPLRACIAAARAAAEPAALIYLSPQGERLTQASVRRLAAQPRVLLMCGRYEGIDERLIASEVDEEISIGDYVLSGGELAAAVLLDAIGRLQDGALNDADSAAQDSFEDGLLDCPHYTRSDALGTLGVPEVLMSGDHAAIRRWRRQQSLGRTWLRRPDLLARAQLSKEDRALLEAFRAAWMAEATNKAHRSR